MVECSIIIPVHNRASLTRQCLNRLLELSAPANTEIIVVDGASTDLTAELLRSYGERMRVVTQTVKQGFAASCNEGAAIATGEYLILLNNDTLPQPGWLENLLGYAREHPRAAVVGAKLLYPDDTVQHAGVVVCQDRYPRHIYTGFPADHPAVCTSRRFQIVTAACALVRRDLFAAFHGFDTDYLNGYEDVDLCLRMGEQGHEIHYCHTAVLHHLESATRGLTVLEENLRRYREHWLERVAPDEFGYYLDDGLIEVDYSPAYPLQMKISPLLSTFHDPVRETRADHLLHLRARQASQQRREPAELYTALGEMEFAQTFRANLVSESPSTCTRPYPSFPASAAGSTTRDEDLIYPEAENIMGGHFKEGGERVRTEMPAAISQRTIRVPLPGSTPTRLVSDGKIHALKGGAEGSLYSILMPVKNGAKQLLELLPRVLEQQAKGTIEIIAVDSGSTDETVEILQRYGATILEIPPEQFNHGLTRNLAANHAHGEVFIFLNQSALPVDDLWLANLVAPFAKDEKLAGVCSRLVPRANADLLVQKDVLRDPSSAAQSRVSVITDWHAYQALSPDALRYFINFHSISTAIRPEVLERIPLPAVRLIGEDLAWAKQVLEAGYALRQEAGAAVFHSHDYSDTELLQRNFDDAVLNHTLVGRQIEAAMVMPGIVAEIADDWRLLAQAGTLAPAEVERLRREAVMRRTAQWVGQWLGGHLDELPRDAVRHLALTERIKAEGRAQPAGDDFSVLHPAE